MTIGCSLVDTTRNTNRFQQPSNVIATIPIPQGNLNDTITNLGSQTFVAPLRNGTNCDVCFFVKDNTLKDVVKLYVQFEAFFS